MLSFSLSKTLKIYGGSQEINHCKRAAERRAKKDYPILGKTAPGQAYWEGVIGLDKTEKINVIGHGERWKGRRGVLWWKQASLARHNRKYLILLKVRVAG